jgi:anti-sigma factor ChrR (cupin superfamily)
MFERALLPGFVRDALEDAEAEHETAAVRAARECAAARALGGLEHANLLEFEQTELPSSQLFARLESTIALPPHRYAPFFASAAELLDLPQAALIEQLARLADPAAWRFAGLPGIHQMAVAGGPRVRNAETLFVRFAPGVRFPEHRHTGIERVLVLEGSYRDSSGVEHRPGELRTWLEGSAHSFEVTRDHGCIFASVVFGRRFSSWPLRALAKILGR